MRLREQVTEACIAGGSDLNHSLIDLSKLQFEPFSFGDASAEEALKQSVEKARKKRVTAFSIELKSGTILRVVSVKAGNIPLTHPQIVKTIMQSEFCIMRGHNVV